MFDYGECVDRGILLEHMGKDAILDNVAMHIAEVSAMYNCKLYRFLKEEQIVIIFMEDDCIPHEHIDQMLHVVFALTKGSYHILVCYNGKVRYEASKTDEGMECKVFGIAK